MLLASCEGAFGWMYDDPQAPASPAAEVNADESLTVTLSVNANSWGEWHYIDLAAVVSLLRKDPKADINTLWTTRPIPLEPTGPEETETGHRRPGQYLYWFDTNYGLPVRGSEFRSFTPTAAQDDPEEWSFAVHRSEVRTNGGAVWASTLTDIDRATEADYRSASYTPDDWSENEVWSDSRTMISQLVPSQGIAVNRVLGSWLRMTLMPDYERDGRVFFLRLKDGTYAALQLINHIGGGTPENPSPIRCYLTIKMRYPLP